MRRIENNIISVAILLSVNKKNTITCVWLTANVKKLPTLAPPCCVKNAALVSAHIMLVIIYSQRIFSNFLPKVEVEQERAFSIKSGH